MKITKLLISAIAVFTFAAANMAHAQTGQTATVTASGTVLSPVTVSGTDLNFGTSIFPGVNEAVPYTNTNAAQFNITGGEGTSEVNVTFPNLPSELTGTGTPLSINFSTEDAAHNTTESVTGATPFDPNTGVTTNLATGALYVWLGGTVQPSSDQPAGAYSANIMIDVVYTGN